MTLSDRAEWRGAVRRLRRIAPLQRKVRIVRSHLQVDCAHCFVGDDHRITICSSLDLEASIDAVLHEWAHAWLFEEDGTDPATHPDSFWIKFGELYRAWHHCD